MRRVLYLGIDPPEKDPSCLVTHLPLIQIVPREITPDIEKAFRNISSYTYILFTSKNGVRTTCDLLKTLDICKSKIKGKIIAVGKKTAAFLKENGLLAALVAEEETAEGIIDLLQHICLKNQLALWPHSSLSRRVIADFFKEKECPITECVLYDTVTLPYTILPDLRTFQEIIFTSPSTVQAFIEIFPEVPEGIVLTPIGPITKKSLGQILSFGSR